MDILFVLAAFGVLTGENYRVLGPASIHSHIDPDNIVFSKKDETQNNFSIEKKDQVHL